MDIAIHPELHPPLPNCITITADPISQRSRTCHHAVSYDAVIIWLFLACGFNLSNQPSMAIFALKILNPHQIFSTTLNGPIYREHTCRCVELYFSSIWCNDLLKWEGFARTFTLYCFVSTCWGLSVLLLVPNGIHECFWIRTPLYHLSSKDVVLYICSGHVTLYYISRI